MAKFTPGEVANLQSGGNGKAREIYFKELDLSRNPLPDSSDSIKLRNFINHVYVERRYTGERPAPRSQDGGRDDGDYRRPELRKPGFQSPSSDDQMSDRRPNDRFNDRARKSDVGGYQNEKRSPNRFEPDRPPRKSYDDREGRRDEKAVPETTRERAKPPVRPFSFRNSDDDGPPVRSVKEILGDDVPSLRVDLNNRSLPGRIPAPTAQQKDGLRSQSLDHVVNGEAAAAAAPAVKRASSESMISLIDFGADPEPVVASAPASDPFAAKDPFAPAAAATPTPVPAPANTSVLDLFSSGPFAVAPVSKPAADLFAAKPASDPFAAKPAASDPFGFGAQASSAASGAPSWATFNFSGIPGPPEGYPGAPASTIATKPMAPTPFSGGSAWDTSSSAGGGGWSAFGIQNAAPPAYGASAVPAPVAPTSSQVNMFASLDGQSNVPQSSMQMQMGFVPQQNPAHQNPAHQNSAHQNPAEQLHAPTSASGRVRRELPQDFFAQPGAFGMDARQDLAFSMGAGHMGATQFQQRGPQVATQPSRTRNPFDDDDPPPAPFNMGSMQAALPQVGDPLSGLTSQWGPSFQPTVAPGGAYGYGMQSANLHQQNGPAGAFSQNQGFNQGAMYGGSPFYSQTAGSNPFG